MKLKSKLLTAVSGMAVICAPTVAQDAEEEDGLSLEEIVVTASKREANAQDIPYNVTAVSGNMLDTLNIGDPSDLMKAIPGVVVADAGDRFRNALNIRGIGPGIGASDFFTSEATAYYVGESALQYMNLKVKDLERMEVLRGPQGTLYGAGSMGGTIRYIINKPNVDEVEGRVALDVSKTASASGLSHDIEGVVNVPLVEGKLALRAVASDMKSQGFINYATFPNEAAAGHLPDRFEEDYNDSDTQYGRVSLGWVINDGWRADVAYTKQKQEAWGRQGYTLDGEGNNPDWDVNEDFIDEDTLAGFNDEFSEREIELLQFDLEGDLGFADLHINATRYEDTYHTQGDVTRFLESLFGGYYAGFDELHGYNSNDINSVTKSFEARIQSKGGEKIDWVGGVFYEQQDRVWDLIEHTPGLNEWLWGSGTSVTPNDFALLSSGDYSQKAVYGEVTWHATDRLDVTGGLRYFDMTDEIEMGIWYPTYDGLSEWGDPATAASYFPDDDDRANQAHDDFYFKGNVSYDVSDDVMVYGTFSQGFRRGGANATSGVQLDDGSGANIDEVLANARFYEPDRLNNYEIGFKSQFADNRVILNGALYWLDWSNRQGYSSRFEDSEGNVVYLPITQRVNGGDAVSKGGELELRAMVSEGLELQAGLSYNKIKDKDDDGFSFAGKPAWQGNTGIFYNRPLDNGWTMQASLNSYYRTSIKTNQELQEKLSGYIMADAAFGVSSEVWDLRLSVSNLTNKDVQSSLTMVEGRPVMYRNTPRTVTMTVAYNF